MSARIAQLDGIRGTAVLLVFALHVGLFPYGWLGVPIFFVLSGFLITGILRRARNDISYWSPFYLKRALKIVPPLVLTFCAAAWLEQIPWRTIGPYELTFLANVAETRYRGMSQSLGVLWSLSVEEHFYLFWPLVIRFLNRRYLILVLSCILIAEPILRGAATHHFTTFWPIFFLTPFQLDGLAFGSLLAILFEDKKAICSLRPWLGPALIITVTLFAVLSCSTNFRREANSVIFNSAGYSLVNVGSTLLLAYVLARPRSRTSTFFGNKYLTSMGVVSYGLYLFHLLVIRAIQNAAVGLGVRHLRPLAPIELIIAFVIAWSSFVFYEEPLLKLGRRLVRRRYENGADRSTIVLSERIATYELECGDLLFAQPDGVDPEAVGAQIDTQENPSPRPEREHGRRLA